MKAARLLIDCLRNEGVERIFGIPGEENLDVMDEIHSSGMKFVLTRHEQAAAFMAGTVGRLTGRPGVCLSTLGPGATNLVTGVADAYLSNLPMIALVAQAGASRRNPPQKQVIDLLAMFRPITKSAIDVGGPEEIALSVRKAFTLAVRERPGPIMLQLPEDTMKKESGAHPAGSMVPPAWNGVQRPLDLIRGTLRESDRPLVLIGHGVIRERAVLEVRALCEAWNMPGGCTWMAAGALPYDHPLSLGTVGMRNSDLVKECYEEADSVLLIGYDASEFQPQYWNRGREKKIMYLGRAGSGPLNKLGMRASALGDLPFSLRRLTEGAVKKKDWCSSHRDKQHQEMESTTVGPKSLVQAMRRQLGREDVLVSDVGAHLIWLAKYFPAYEPNTLLLQNGLISMGVAVPSAIAARMVHPEKKVVAVVGDGGFLMSSAELETARRYDVNFVTVIFNDGGLGLIREKMRRSLGRSSNVDLGSPDIPTFARSMGAKGYAVQERDFEAVLEDCLNRDIRAVIDVQVDYSEIADLF